MRTITPAANRPHFVASSHGLEAPPDLRWGLTSRQFGRSLDEKVPLNAREQADICFANCAATLAEAGMGPEDVFRINAFVTDRADTPAYLAARDAWLAGSKRKPASTLVIVSGFTRPEFLVEAEVTAAKACGSGQDVLIKAAQNRADCPKDISKGCIGAGQKIGGNRLPGRPVRPPDDEVQSRRGRCLAADLLAKIAGLGGKGLGPDRRVMGRKSGLMCDRDIEGELLDDHRESFETALQPVDRHLQHRVAVAISGHLARPHVDLKRGND